MSTATKAPTAKKTPTTAAKKLSRRKGYQTVGRIVKEASEVRGWLDMFIGLMPLLTELLQQILDGCAKSEADAVRMIARPTKRERSRAHARLMRRLYLRSAEFRKLPRSERSDQVWVALEDIEAVAAESPDLVAVAYREVKTAA